MSDDCEVWEETRGDQWDWEVELEDDEGEPTDLTSATVAGLIEWFGGSLALTEAIRLGADGLVSDDGLHRLAVGLATPPPIAEELPPVTPAEVRELHQPMLADDQTMGEAVLTADELRALLYDQPTQLESDKKE